MTLLPDSEQPTPNRGETPVPQQIGRYRILGPLGAGGMGKVFKAHDPQLERVVALKLPHFEGAPDKRQQRLQRFQREARTAAQVWHTNVCPLYDVGEQDGQPFVVMAYIEGHSLEEVLKKRGRIEEVGEAVALILQVLDGLDAIHAAGLVHRDVKPSNILIDQQGRPMVVDFGLARTDHEGEILTSDGVIVGTPTYMAPEQAGGRTDQIGPWTDLYSLGVVFYRMVTGRIPFEGPPLAVLGRIVNDPIPPPSQFRSNLDPAIEGILLKALAKEPDARFSNARQFAKALREQVVQPLSQPVGPEKPDTATAMLSVVTSNQLLVKAVRPRKIRMWLRLSLAGAACWVVGVGVGGCAAAWNLSPPPVAVTVSVLGLTLVGTGFFLVSLLEWAFCRPRLLLNIAGNSKGMGGVNTRFALNLLREGIPVDSTDVMSETPLMKAAQIGDTELAKLLLMHGANVTLRNQFGQTALMIAISKKHQDLMDLLKQAGARE